MNESEFKKVIIVKSRRAGYSHQPYFDINWVKKNILHIIDKSKERIKTIDKIFKLKNG